MSNAAIYLHPNGFDTSGSRILGRHSAGESFLRGFLRYADVDAFHFWNVINRPQAELERLVARIHPPQRPVHWIGATNRQALAIPGVVNIPSPNIVTEAWHRRVAGAQSYAITGITHTTATANVMRLLGDMLTGPTEPYDALICTSSAVRASVETQLDGIRAYLAEAHGPRRRAEPQRVTIPLGVNVTDFETTPENRKAWRERLDIPDDAVVALYVGRFNVAEKMNPALMAIALERAAQATGRPIYWVNSGWYESSIEGPGAEAAEASFHENVRALCPSIQYRIVDGRPPDTRFSIWSAADFFISFSDNIQETFGLTPVEAMAAGLPCVVTDWDGYKDTVRHGEDGFRIPTYAPAPGDGVDLAYWFSNDWITYPLYVAGAAQYTAIDFAEATAAISVLVMNPVYRRQLGAKAKARAREVFDWAAIIPQYQALWADQTARRLAEPTVAPNAINPFRPDPFTLFGNYPTRHPNRDWLVAPSAGMGWIQAAPLLASPLASDSGFNRATLAEIEQVVTWLQGRPPTPIGQLLEIFPAQRRPRVGRTLLWIAKFGVISLHPTS